MMTVVKHGSVQMCAWRSWMSRFLLSAAESSWPLGHTRPSARTEHGKCTWRLSACGDLGL